MEEGNSNGSSQSWLPHPPRDERKKYRSLKRKYRLLEEENADLSEEVVRSRRLIGRLQNERTFILDRLLRLERFYRTSDTDSDSDGSSDSEVETEAKRKEANGTSPSSSKRAKTASGASSSQPASIINVDPESLGLCVAVVRDRPCKSKALSGFKYCWHHAPLDPNSPFIWCQYRGSSKNKKCSIPVLKTKDQPFCKYHMDQAQKEGAEKDKDGTEKEKEKEGEKEKAKEGENEKEEKEKDIVMEEKDKVLDLEMEKGKEKEDGKDKEKEEKEKEKGKDKTKKKEKKERHKKKKEKKKKSKDKKTEKIKEEVKALKMQLKGLEQEELRINGVALPLDKVVDEEEAMSGEESRQLMITEDSDSDEGMTIVDVEDDEIHLI